MNRDEIIKAIVDERKRDGMLLEMSIIGRILNKNRVCHYTIAVDEESSRVGNPYFKVFDARSRKVAKRSLRISFLEPKVIYHQDGYKPIRVTKELGRFIDDFMNSTNSSNPLRTNWVESLVQYNIINGNLDILDDASRLTKEVIASDPKKYRRCIPVDLPKPTYANLA